MKCEDIEAVMIDYLDNTIDDGFRREIENHLETCERCLDELRECQQVMQLISKDEMVNPDDSLRINFYHMLHSEIKKSESWNISTFQTSTFRWYNRGWLKIAAGFAILICGTFLGMIISAGIIKSYNSVQLEQLNSEVIALKKTALFIMLKGGSSSDRIQAVNYADEIKNPDEPVIEVLVKTLNQDKNVNVRMAAAYALARFADQRSVCDSLVNSLYHQDDPILQVTLINILVERKEKSAIKPIQQIISDKSTIKEVKDLAENGVKLLI